MYCYVYTRKIKCHTRMNDPAVIAGGVGCCVVTVVVMVLLLMKGNPSPSPSPTNSSTNLSTSPSPGSTSTSTSTSPGQYGPDDPLFSILQELKDAAIMMSEQAALDFVVRKLEQLGQKTVDVVFSKNITESKSFKYKLNNIKEIRLNLAAEQTKLLQTAEDILRAAGKGFHGLKSLASKTAGDPTAAVKSVTGLEPVTNMGEITTDRITATELSIIASDHAAELGESAASAASKKAATLAAEKAATQVAERLAGGAETGPLEAAIMVVQAFSMALSMSNLGSYEQWHSGDYAKVTSAILKSTVLPIVPGSSPKIPEQPTYISQLDLDYIQDKDAANANILFELSNYIQAHIKLYLTSPTPTTVDPVVVYVIRRILGVPPGPEPPLTQPCSVVYTTPPQPLPSNISSIRSNFETIMSDLQTCYYAHFLDKATQNACVSKGGIVVTDNIGNNACSFNEDDCLNKLEWPIGSSSSPGDSLYFEWREISHFNKLYPQMRPKVTQPPYYCSYPTCPTVSPAPDAPGYCILTDSSLRQRCETKMKTMTGTGYNAYDSTTGLCTNTQKVCDALGLELNMNTPLSELGIPNILTLVPDGYTGLPSCVKSDGLKFLDFILGGPMLEQFAMSLLEKKQYALFVLELLAPGGGLFFYAYLNGPVCKFFNHPTFQGWLQIEGAIGMGLCSVAIGAVNMVDKCIQGVLDLVGLGGSSEGRAIMSVVTFVSNVVKTVLNAIKDFFNLIFG